LSKEKVKDHRGKTRPSIEEMTIKGKIGDKTAEMIGEKIKEQKIHNAMKIYNMVAKMKETLWWGRQYHI